MFRGGEAALGPAVRPVVAGGSGGCRLKMNCRPSLNYMSSASLLPLRSVSTVAFRFHSKFQFQQLSSESTVFTSSVVVRWFLVMLILHHLLEMLLESHLRLTMSVLCCFSLDILRLTGCSNDRTIHHNRAVPWTPSTDSSYLPPHLRQPPLPQLLQGPTQ